jgi:hypothetical protein
MATTFTSGAAASNSAFRPPTGGILGVREAVYDFTAAFVVNDVIQMIPVAKGERAVGGQLIVETDLDSSTGVVVSVGDGIQADRYISGSAVGQAGGVALWGAGIDTAAEAALFNYKYTAADTIDVKITTAATGTPAATGRIRLRVFIVAA